jgi:DNA replication protein DnaC
VLDDFGLKPLVDPAPSDLYEVMNERYEVASMLVTSNRAPTEWPDLFGENRSRTREGKEVRPCSTAEKPRRSLGIYGR